MRRIANGTQVSALPTPAAAVGTPGYGSNGDPAGGIPATVFDAHSYNALQEEIVRVIEAAGITPDGANLAQLLAALRVLISGQVFSLVSSQTVIVPVWATHCEIEGLWGAGGGGGGAGTSAAGGGGAGGGFARGVLPVTPGASIAAVIGAGGAPGTTGGGNGGPGGTTSFGPGMSATGGTGGGGSSAGYGGGGTTPGLGVGGSMQAPGQAGQRAIAQRDPLNSDGIVFIGGQGGGAVWSGPTHASIGASAWGGWMFGGGAAGGANNSAGGQGSPGYILGRWLP